MLQVVLGVAGTLAAVVVPAAAFVGAAVLRYRANGLHHLARRQRHDLVRRLKLQFELSDEPNGASEVRRWASVVADSFEVRVPQLSEMRGSELLKRLAQSTDSSAYVINAGPGTGKTTFALALALLAPQAPWFLGAGAKEMVPIYIHLAEGVAEEAVARIDAELRRCRTAAGRLGLSGRPLLLLDALNERVSPTELPSVLATLLSAERVTRLRDLEAIIVFCTNFRAETTVAVVHDVLRGTGLNPAELTLRFLPERPQDLQAVPAVTESHRAVSEIAEFVTAYSARFPDWSLRRSQVVALLRWLDDAADLSPVGLAERVPRAPSPVDLVLRETLSGAATYSDELRVLAQIAFTLCGREVTSSGPSFLAGLVAESGISPERLTRILPGDRVLYEGGIVRFRREIDVYNLAALHIALRLAAPPHESPQQLRGRSTYDVAAPFLLPALRWVRKRVGSIQVDRIQEAVLAELVDEDGPYSFYACVLSYDFREEYSDAVAVQLLRSMIAAINADRGRSCVVAIRSDSGPQELPPINAVLDQLFQVTRTSANRAVPLLVDLLGDDDQAVRSQAAYLLLAWVDGLRRRRYSGQRHAELLRDWDRRRLVKLAGMIPRESNLHVRFHEIEIVESCGWIMTREAADDRVRMAFSDARRRLSTADPDIGAPYPELHETLSAYLAEMRREHTGTSRWVSLIDRVLEDPLFSLPSSSMLNERDLECWEVALGLCARAYRYRPTLKFEQFLDASLERDQWIPRWWGFSNLVALLHDGSSAVPEIATDRFAARIIAQLYAPGEPLGLKLHQCTLVEDILHGHASGLACTAIRSQLRSQVFDRRAVVDAYSTVLGRNSEEYLREFFLRLERIDGLSRR